MSVKVLSPEIAEHIAAGEVVENPSSVVKELVENSLDAGACRVEVSVVEGGKKSISVVDNGQGIYSRDLPVIFKRYATSKIARMEDLVRIESLGFRGEALPSIAAVSRITLVSRRQGEPSAFQIRVEGGKLIDRREMGAPEGTAVLVEDLFYNTPARLKFLKSPPVETSRISFLLWELALAYPGVSFSLQSNGRSLVQTSGDGSLVNIMGAIYGAECARALLPLNRCWEEGPIGITGYISAPYYHRSSRRGVTLIVNDRVVKAPQITYALERGYGNLLPRGRYPLATIRIQLPPELLDVNVHPSKTTVRFQNPETLSDLVYRAVKAVIAKRLPLPPLRGSTASPGAEAAPRPSISPPVDGHGAKTGLPQVGEGKMSYYLRTEKNSGEQQQEITTGNLSFAEAPKIALIGQFLHSYLVAQRGEELLLIDQHAAHERLLYHRLMVSPPGRQAVQLTLPLEVEIPAPWRERFGEIDPTLQELGFKLEPFGDNNYILRQLPLLVRGEFTDADIQDLIEEMLAEEPEPGLSKREQICRSIACHRAIKAKDKLSRQEMETLLEEWLAVPGYQYCPHGRPSIISFHRGDLNKLFQRQGGQ